MAQASPLEARSSEELGDNGVRLINGVARKVVYLKKSSFYPSWLFFHLNRFQILKVTMVIDSGRESAVYHVHAPAQDKPRTKQLPVTLLSGFLVGTIYQQKGTGKASIDIVS